MSESVIKSSTATIQVGASRADGKLSLTATDLAFVPYNHKLGFGPYTFKRQDIRAVTKCMGKGAGFIPVTTDAFSIHLTGNRNYEFIVAGSGQWIELLSEKVT